MSKKILTVFIAEYLVNWERSFRNWAILPEKYTKKEIEKLVKMQSLVLDLQNWAPAWEAIAVAFAKPEKDWIFAWEVNVLELEYFSDEAKAIWFIKWKEAELDYIDNQEDEADEELKSLREHLLEEYTPDQLGKLVEQITSK